MDWSDVTVNTVRAAAVPTSTNLSGDDLRPDSSSLAGTSYMASVQQATALYAADLAQSAGIQAGRAAFTVFFAAPPVDSGRALRDRDLILWDTGSGTRVLTVVGPVRDEGGAGEAWSCDCIEEA
jgi:hypothetical protein